MDQDELRTLLDIGHERRSVEAKSSRPWDEPRFRAKVLRAMMGMSNLQDGGVVLIGVGEDSDDRFVEEGVPEKHLSTYQHDEIVTKLGEYADPPPEFTSDIVELGGNKYFVLEVQPFEVAPTICKKNSVGILQRGDVYTRSRHRRETHAISSEKEMREVLDRALTRRRRRFIDHMRKLGLVVDTEEEHTDVSPYDAELEDLP